MPVVLYSMTNYTSARGGSRCAVSTRGGKHPIKSRAPRPPSRARKEENRETSIRVRQAWERGGRRLCTLIPDLPTFCFTSASSCLPFSHLSLFSILSISLCRFLFLPRGWSSLLLALFSRTVSRCARAHLFNMLAVFYSHSRMIRYVWQIKNLQKISKDDITSALLFLPIWTILDKERNLELEVNAMLLIQRLVTTIIKITYAISFSL